MSINFDATQISVKCPKCGKELKETLGRLKRQKYITCPTCGRIAADTKGLVSAERSVNNQLDSPRKDFSIKLKF